MARTYYPTEKRLDKVPPYLKEDITFDLINAFGLVKGPIEAALILKDLLTKKELNNLAKRLRIAKEILSGSRQEEIINHLHCGFGMISRVQMWLREGGEGLRKVIARLPKRKERPKRKLHLLPSYYRTPQLLFEAIQHLQAHKEDKRIRKFLESVESKALSDKMLREALDDYYRNQQDNKKKIQLA